MTSRLDGCGNRRPSLAAFLSLVGVTSFFSIWSILALVVASAKADVVLGSFDFDSAQFGNTLLQSDGGALANGNWLNVVRANPGSPAFLTGPTFDTGIANITLRGTADYTIGYATPIVNHAGADLGVVVARFASDSITIAFSTDGGATFTPTATIPPTAAVSTGVHKSYFYGANSTGGPFDATLFVSPVDLTTYGIPANASVNAIRVSGFPELDLIRVAGFSVPEPSSIVLLLLGGAALAALGWRRKSS